MHHLPPAHPPAEAKGTLHGCFCLILLPHPNCCCWLTTRLGPASPRTLSRLCPLPCCASKRAPVCLCRFAALSVLAVLCTHPCCCWGLLHRQHVVANLAGAGSLAEPYNTPVELRAPGTLLLLLSVRTLMNVFTVLRRACTLALARLVTWTQTTQQEKQQQSETSTWAWQTVTRPTFSCPAECVGSPPRHVRTPVRHLPPAGLSCLAVSASLPTA